MKKKTSPLYGTKKKSVVPTRKGKNQSKGKKKK